MRTVNQISIQAPWRKVFEAAARVERWPQVLPHYRWVKVLASKGGLRTVDMAAHRDGIPCRWRSEQVLYPGQKRIYYRHIRSRFTQGMDVWWILTPRGRGRTDVLLTHAMPPERPGMAWFRQRVVGDAFVRVIADRTLAGLKRHLEAA